MRFIKDGPDVPDRLVQKHEDGHVIFFCGAGISYPADLPGFAGLVHKVYDALGETPTKIEAAAIKEFRFDAALDLFERRIGDRIAVRKKIFEILQPKVAAYDTHKALVAL